MTERRDWLRKTYPNGMGLGDLVREYCIYKFERENTKENALRRAEITLALDCMGFHAETPTFSKEFGEIYL